MTTPTTQPEDDLVVRPSTWDFLVEAADALDRQASEITLLREALREIAKPGVGAAEDWSLEECNTYWASMALTMRAKARTALKEQP